MGNWNEIHEEIVARQIKRQRESPSDEIRRKYLRELHELTGRNVVAYYSGWLQRPGPDFAALTSITDDDKNGFMACFKGFDWSKGLDLILHLPGGNIAATETIIDYLRSMFGANVRTIVPQISMSAGTLLSQAEHAIEWSRELGEKALREGMLKDDANPGQKAKDIVDFLLSHDSPSSPRSSLAP